jgi:hypothetical protein
VRAEKERALIDASKETGLEINTEKLSMLISHHQTARKNHNIKIANRSFKMWQSSDIWE